MDTPLSREERLAQWETACVQFWYRAHTERSFPFKDLPPEYKERVFDLICVKNLPFAKVVVKL